MSETNKLPGLTEEETKILISFSGRKAETISDEEFDLIKRLLTKYNNVAEGFDKYN